MSLAGQPIETGAPVVGSGRIVQIHRVGGMAISTGAPVVGTAAAAQSGTVLPAPANRRGLPFRIGSEYRTEIITARSGREQRRALRQSPRRRLKWETTLSGGCLAAFRAAMVTAQRGEVIAAERPRSTRLAVPLAAQDPVAEVTAAPAWLVQGAVVLLIGGGRMQYRGVAAVDGTAVSFTAADAAGWPAGTIVCRAVRGELAAEIATALWQPLEVVEAEIIVDVVPGSEPVPAPPAPAVTFEGREVLLERPDRRAPVEITHAQARETVDYGHGRTASFHPVAWAGRLWRAEYTRCSPEEAARLAAFFDRAKGRRGSFRMPSFARDLVPKTPPAQGTDTLTVAGLATARAWGGSPVWQVLAAFAPGGPVFRRVTEIAEADGDSVLTLDAAWPEDIPAGTAISWMPVWRLASDGVTEEWLKDGVARIALPLQLLDDIEVDGEPE